MKTTKLLFAFCAILLCLPNSSITQYLYLDSSLTISSSTTFDSVRITSAGRLTADDSIAVLGNMMIDSGGIVTHSVRLLSGLRLNISGTLDIKTGGAIDVSSKGLLGGHPTGGPGETYNSNDSIVAGAGGAGGSGAGASYGGWGTQGSQGSLSNQPYGLLEEPRHLGSGGGGNQSSWGGHGGGRITVTASSCIVDGAIRTNGAHGVAGFTQTGGGSGGSIKLLAGILSGTGVIEAVGGNGQQYISYSGSGGGGRIAVFYNAITLQLSNISARGGSGTGASASSGTIYLKDQSQPTGSVIINNGNVNCTLYTPWLSGLSTVQQLTLRNRAQLQSVVGDNASFDEVGIESNSTLLLDTNSTFVTPVVRINGATLTTNIDRLFPTGTDLQLTGGGTINVQNNRTLSVGVFDTTNIRLGTVNITEGCRLDIALNTATIGAGVTLVKDGTFGGTDSIQTLTINNGGMLTHSTRLLAGLQLNVLDTLDIKTGGAIDVSNKGLLGGHPTGGPGETYNANDSIVAGANGSDYRCAGASYGGRGADASIAVISNPPYGLLEEPRHLGSGGGGNRYFWGGHGGGRVTIIATACIVNGALRANGGSGSGGFDPSGGGSGGAILLNVGNLSGTGVIEAIGGAGNAWTYYSGSGGGGRVAIYYDLLNLPTQNISVRGGSGTGASASSGAIYLKDQSQPTGSVIIDNGNVNCALYTPWLSGLSTVQQLTLRNRAQLQSLIGDDASFEFVSIESNSTLLLDTNSTFVTPVVRINGATLTINVDRSFLIGTDLQLTGSGTINVQNNRILNLGVFDTTNIKSGTVNLTKGSRLDISSNSATVGTGVTLIKDGMFGEADSLKSLTILNGGTVSHSSRLFAGLNLHLLDTLEVRQGGSIDVSSKGLLGGSPAIGGGSGETYNANDSIVAGANGSDYRCAGASYGGRGADANTVVVSNTPYGFLEEPRHLGSGGGGNRYFWGGHGGGRVTIIATACIVNGALRANGGSGSGGFDPSGGGSGGGILLTVGNLSGTGVIEAIGGAGNAYTYYSGSGGGGRIAVFYNAITLQLSNISARGGSGTGASASSGTIYLKDQSQPTGSVIIDNGNVNCALYTPWLSGLSAIQNLSVMKAGKLEINEEINIEGQLLMNTGGKIGRP